MLGIAMTDEALCGLRFGISLLVEGKSAGSLTAALFQVGSHVGAVTGEAGAGAVGAGDGSLAWRVFMKLADRSAWQSLQDSALGAAALALLTDIPAPDRATIPAIRESIKIFLRIFLLLLRPTGRVSA